MNSKVQAEWILIKSRFKTYIETLLISFVKLSRLKIDKRFPTCVLCISFQTSDSKKVKQNKKDMAFLWNLLKNVF